MAGAGRFVIGGEELSGYEGGEERRDGILKVVGEEGSIPFEVRRVRDFKGESISTLTSNYFKK
jgi:hypothetical protein